MLEKFKHDYPVAIFFWIVLISILLYSIGDGLEYVFSH